MAWLSGSMLRSWDLRKSHTHTKKKQSAFCSELNLQFSLLTRLTYLDLTAALFLHYRMTIWLSTAPTEPLTHWYQVRCLLQSPLFTKAGDTLSGTALLVANRRYGQTHGLGSLCFSSSFISSTNVM